MGRKVKSLESQLEKQQQELNAGQRGVCVCVSFLFLNHLKDILGKFDSVVAELSSPHPLPHPVPQE